MRDRRESRFGLFARLAGWSAIMGILGMAFLAPGLTVGSFGVNTVVSIFENLPAYIKPVNGSDASTIYAMKDGQPVEVATFYEENRKSIPFEQMSPNIVNAVISTEDPRFYQHGGVDWVSFIRATLTNVAMGGNGPGGSTITMQYVKNTLVEAATLAGDKEAAAAATVAGGVPGLMRKMREIRLALALEQQTSKKDILAGYLNLSFFGGQVYGIEQASVRYFGVKASELSVAQAALLGGMLQAPNLYRPDVAENLTRATERRNYVINNMRSEGYITQEQADSAKAEPIKTNPKVEPAGCEASENAAFFCDYVVWTIRNSPEFGPTPAEREQLLRRGGLDIYTSLDLDVQAAADKAVKKYVPPDDKSGLGAASVSVQVGTGRILSMAVNRIFDQTEKAKDTAGHGAVNYATDFAYGGSSGFQTGSTYKVFTLADWLISGKKLGDHVDARIKEWNAADFTASCGGINGVWKPKNSHSAPEDVNIMTATAQSINTAYASMASQLDLCDIRDTAMRFGVHRADGNELMYVPSSVLGTNEISPLTMAAAFAGIANKGTYCSPVAIDRLVKRSTNTEMTVPKSLCSQAVAPEIAAAMTTALRTVISGGTGTASNPGDGTPVAGKTGTTDSSVQTWMVGYSTAVSTAVWVGNVVGKKSLNAISIKGASAYVARHSIWRSTMKAANKVYKGTAFMGAPATLTGTTDAIVPNVVGLAPDAAVAAIEAADLNAKIMPIPVASMQASGTVDHTSDPAGTVKPRGSQIQIYVSVGGQIVVPNVSGMTVAAARDALLMAGFAAVSEPVASQSQYFVQSSVAKGLVAATDPAAGSTVASGGAVMLIISNGP